MHLKSQFGEIGDLRVTVMAGIMIMDEVAELTRRVSGLEAELEGLRSNRDTVLAANARSEETLATVIDEGDDAHPRHHREADGSSERRAELRLSFISRTGLGTLWC